MIAAAAGCNLLAAGCGVPALPWLLRDGTPAVLRRIGPDDAAALQAMLLRQSRASRRFRFHTPVEGLTPSQLARLTGNDNPLQLALVLVTGSGTTAPTVIAEARYASEDGISAELAVIVDEAWRRQGIARRLLGALMQAARSARLQSLRGDVLHDNDAMLSLARSACWPVTSDRHDGRVRCVRIELSQQDGS